LKKIFFSFCLFALLSSQDCLSEASINEEYFNDDVIGLYLSAIDFNSGASNFLFFDYSIDGFTSNNNSSCIENGFFKGGFKIDFDISMFIDQYHTSPELVADGHMNIYDIPSGLSSIRFRNTDLNFDTENLQGAKYNLKDAQIYIESQQDELSQLFIETGRVPNGRYYFNFKLTICSENNDGVLDDCDVDNPQYLNKQVDIFVPSYIDLLSPGSNSLSDTLTTQISNIYPTFQWNSDYCSNCEFSIRISEYKPVIHSSLQDAINDYSILPAESGFYDLNSNINVFQYPGSGFESLIEGNYYVWQIKRSYETTNGTFDDYSELFVFKINSPSESSDIRYQEDQSNFTLDNIRLLIGESNYNQLFNNGGPLYGYENVEPNIQLNNETLSSNFLLQLIQMLNNNQIEIIEVNVE